LTSDARLPPATRISSSQAEVDNGVEDLDGGAGVTIWSDALALAGLIGLGMATILGGLERAFYEEPWRDEGRIYLARRAAHVTRLTGAGMPREDAEAWCDAWEARAAAKGRERHDRTFWRDGGAWIETHR
jgi:hypothetical protein